MKKTALPKGFPTGARITQHLSQAFRQRAYAGLSTKSLPPMISPYGGPAPKRGPASTFEGDVRGIRAKAHGTLSQFLSAKHNPQELRTQGQPMLSQGEIPPDVSSGANVNRGSGLVRDAETQKAASDQARQLLREHLAALRV